MSFVDWLLGFIGMDRSSRSLRQFWREYKNRHRYLVLNRDILEPLDDFDLVDAVVDYVRLKTAGSRHNEFRIVSSLPRGFQAVYSTWWVQAELNNGGFHQYFYNWGVDWGFMALEGYQLFGASRLVELMACAIDIYLREEPEQMKHRAEDLGRLLEQYVKARSISALPELDAAFAELQGSARVAQYIRTHLDEFVAS